MQANPPVNPQIIQTPPDPALINAIANLLWPFVAFFIALLVLGVVIYFRNEIRKLITKTKKLKWGSFEWEVEAEQFEKTVDNVVEESERSPLITTTKRHYTLNAETGQFVLQGNQVNLKLGHRVSSAPTEEQNLIQSEHGLLPRPIGRNDLNDLKSHIIENAFEAVFLIHASLEQEITDILATKGVKLRRRRHLLDIAQKLQLRMQLSPEFAYAVQKFSHLRNQAAHTGMKIPHENLIKIAAAGLHLLEFVQRIPREIIYIQQTALPVYTGKEGKTLAPEYEGIYLLFAALPGQTGAGVYAITPRKGYYRTGEMVSSEWEKESLSDLWVQSLAADRLIKINTGTNAFIGKHIDELIE